MYMPIPRPSALGEARAHQRQALPSLPMRRSACWTGNEEPALQDLLQDEVLLRLLRRNGLLPAQLAVLMEEARQRLLAVAQPAE